MVLNWLQQGPQQSNVTPCSPWCLWEPSQSSTLQKDHIFPLIPAVWEQENTLCVATSENLAKFHVAIWSWEDVLDLPSLWLKKAQARYGISTDFKVFIRALKRRCWGRIWQRRQVLWNQAAIRQPVLWSWPLKWLAVPTGLPGLFTWIPVRKALRSCGTFSWFSCAWSFRESHPLNPCWNANHNKEETEQRSDCDTFLLEHSAAEARRPGSSRILCWIKGIKSKWTPTCCPSAWVNVDEPKYCGAVKTPVAVRSKDRSFF